MRLNLDKEWYERKARQEEGLEVGAGAPAESRCLVREAELPYQSASESNLARAFSLLIHLRRRELKWSLEELATRADVDLADLSAVERCTGGTPLPGTVVQLSKALSLPISNLSQLADISGSLAALDLHSFRFAARALEAGELTDAEQASLKEFSNWLSEKR